MIISIGTTFDIICVTVSLKMEACSLTSKSVSAESYSDKSAALSVWSEFTWELHMPYGSLIRRWIKIFKSNFAKLIWCWQWVTKFVRSNKYSITNITSRKSSSQST